jgi:C1A family cysteine protease
VNADSYYFYGYIRGIIDNFNCSIKTSHAVNIIGYGEEPSKDPKIPPKQYFIIRNSWGTWWG